MERRCSHWTELLAQALSLIDQVNDGTPVVRHWSLGGGTALMLALGHRESFDVDIFVDDPQILPFFNPETRDFAFKLALSDYRRAGTDVLRFAFAGIGEIDIIVAPPVLAAPTGTQVVSGRPIAVDTPFEVVAKKLLHRGDLLQPRDLFDIAATAESFGVEPLGRALTSLSAEAQSAADRVRRMDRSLVHAVLQDLIVGENHQHLTSTAQASALHVLDRIAEETG